MMLKFKPTHFELDYGTDELNIFAAHQAQQIFDAWIKENGKVVYASDNPENSHAWMGDKIRPHDTLKAILIGIEPIEKCTHPKEKIDCEQIRTVGTNPLTYDVDWKCKCGAKVRPKEFEVVE